MTAQRAAENYHALVKIRIRHAMCWRLHKARENLQNFRINRTVTNLPCYDIDAVAHEVTRLLIDWSKGNQDALEQLTPLVYNDLHLRARNYLRHERPDHTLQPTALIHEAYLRLMDDCPPDWDGRSHFLAVASRVMRQILVDHARRHRAEKRGSGAANLSLEEVLIPAKSNNDNIVALDEALAKLAKLDERKCRIIEMRYFGGCTVEETAKALDISSITVIRDTRMAEAWLRRAMLGQEPEN